MPSLESRMRKRRARFNEFMEERNNYHDLWTENTHNRRNKIWEDFNKKEIVGRQNSLVKGIHIGIVNEVPLPIYQKEAESPDRESTPE